MKHWYQLYFWGLLWLGLLAAPQVAAQALRGTFAAGNAHSLAIHGDGTLWATGNNDYGQLGTGTATNSRVWVQVGTDKDWVQVAARAYHSLALKANGTAYAWGGNANAPAAGLRVPTRVSGGGSYIQVAAGDNHSLGLRADGTVYAWGDNTFGQLGDNSGTDRSVPTLVSGGGTYTQVAAGRFHSLGLRADGTAYAWGRNDNGQLGINSTAQRRVPMLVSGGGAYIQLEAGVFHSLGLRADGTAYAWGYNGFGQLGDNSDRDRFTPTPVSGGGLYTQLAAGQVHSLGLRADGTAYAWGDNGDLQLGNTSSMTQRRLPAPVSGGHLYTQLAGGGFHSLGLRADGTLYAWGANANGELGDNSATTRPVPTATGTALPTRSTAAGSNFGLAVRADGTLWAWGDNTFGQLGLGTFDPNTAQLVPVQVGTDQDWVQVAAGSSHSLALKANGTAYAWGGNANGQLGDNSAAIRQTVPTLVSGGGTYTHLAAGAFHSLGLRADGTAYAWGYNAYGQLGDNAPAIRRPVPTLVNGSGPYTQLVGGTDHSVGLRADGGADAWGHNDTGQLGDNSTTDRLVPTAVSGSGPYTQLAAGQGYTLGLRADGTAYAWGFNGYGQLGDNSTTSRRVPTLVGGGGTYSQLAAGSTHSLGLRADGTIYGWGANFTGQLGDNSATDRRSPVPEATLGTNWTALAAGSSFSLARTVSGYQFASTGTNNRGQLGDGTMVLSRRFDRPRPLGSFQPLPVELTQFTAERQGSSALLRWATASESHNDRFEVEVSVEGTSFRPVGVVAGAGSSSQPRAYEFRDPAFDHYAAAVVYYRLHQVDTDGTGHYSPVRAVAVPVAADFVAQVYPNPAGPATPVQVQVRVLHAGDLTLTVVDALGRVRLTRTMMVGGGTSQLALPEAAHWPPGLYVLRLRQGRQQQQVTLVHY